MLFLCTACLLSFKNHPVLPLSVFKISGLAQGTSYHITYYAKDSAVTKKQVDSILDKIDSSLSIYKPYSLISRFNNAPDAVEMDEHLRLVIRRSLEIFKASDGVADITVYPLMELWGFGPRHALVPAGADSLPAVMPCIGSKKIHTRGRKLVKDIPCVKIDVNGIAQGYSVDVVASFLEWNGIKNYLVEIGGELRVKGRKQPGGMMMQIGIEAPAKNNFDEPVIQKIVQFDKGAITTSGNYRKFNEVKGKTITHLMDPKTGYPFHNELISVTVFAKDAITADGYDNALMGMGLKKALLFLKDHPEMEAYFIYRHPDGAIADTATGGFYKMMCK